MGREFMLLLYIRLIENLLFSRSNFYGRFSDETFGRLQSETRKNCWKSVAEGREEIVYGK